MEQYHILKNKVFKNSYKYWNPNKHNIKSKYKKNTHSWFNITKYKNKKKNKCKNKKKIVKVKYIKCKKIKLFPTCAQKYILLNWFNLYIKMYNETLKIFKYIRFNKIKTSLSFKNIRTNFMKQKKDNIINASTIPINKHILDGEMHVQCINHVYLI